MMAGRSCSSPGFVRCDPNLLRLDQPQKRAMKIPVAVKRIIDYSVKIRVKPDKSGVETSNAKMSMNSFCEIALEEMLRIRESGAVSEAVAVPTEALPQAQVSLNSSTGSERAPAETPTDVYGQAASNLVAGTNFDSIVNQLMEMGGGNWDKDTVLWALRAAYNNPERAVEYLYSGIPAAAEVAVPVARPSTYVWSRLWR